VQLLESSRCGIIFGPCERCGKWRVAPYDYSDVIAARGC